MKKELHRQWFDFFLNYAHKLFQDRKYGQCDDIVFFMLDTVIETKPFPFDGFENTDDMLDFFFLYTSYPFSTDTKQSQWCISVRKLYNLGYTNEWIAC